MTRLQAVCMAALWLLGLCSSALGGYRIGVGKSDITGPVAEVVMMGYADMSQKATGLLNRLYARAFIIENTATQQRVVYVNCDIHGVYQLVHQEVINQLQATYDGLYTEQNVVLHATHTHGGPGGASAYFLYDVSILGFIKENFEAIVGGILNAIAAAHDSVEPGSVHFNKGKLMNGGKNRSPDAYLANPAHERAQYTTKHDVDMRALHFRSSNGTLRGILAWFPVHPTSLTQFNKMISGDNKGYAEFLVEQRHPGVIVGVGISNAGDISPNLIDNGDGTFRGEGKTDVESAEIIGRRQADTLMQLLETPNEVLQGSVVGRLSYVDFSNVHIKNADATARNPYANRTCPAVMGQNFAAGTEDGRGLPWFREGDLTTNTLFSTLGSIVKRTPEWVRVCQSSNKAPLLAVGLMWPVPWVPEVLPVQVIKIGQFAIAVTNFEVSTMSGRRLRSKVQEALAITGVSEVEIASMSNAYAQYLTTAEEYATQHYEGASTLFGPNQQAAVEQELVRVAQSVADPSIPLDVGSPPRQFDRERLITFQTGVILDTAGWGKSFGDVRVDTKAAYEIGDIVITEFYGAHPKNLLSNVTSFCDVEKEDETTGRWVTYLTDAHWDVRYEWNRVGISESRSVCSWHLRESDLGTKPGRYRLRHRGYYKPIVGSITPYTGVSSPFEVVVSSAGNQVKLALSCTTSESCAAV